MTTFTMVIVNGCAKVQNKEVYLGNHCIDGSKILQFVWEMWEIGNGKVGHFFKIRPIHMEWPWYNLYPIGAMYLHAETFCKLTATISIPIGEMYLHAGMLCTLAVMITKPVGVMYLPAGTFCALTAAISIPMGAMYLHAET